MRGIRLGCLILTSTWLVCVDLGCHADRDKSATLEPPQEDVTGPGYLVVQELWAREARDHGLDRQSIRLVRKLFQKVVEPNDCQPIDARKLRGSLDRYLDQFAPAFGGKRAEGACHWMAWLLAQAVTRPPVSQQDREQTQRSFTSLVDSVIEALDCQARDGLGPDDYLQCQPRVEHLLQLCRDALGAQFDALHDDPLFPALKTPVSDAVREKVLGHVRTEVFTSGVYMEQYIRPAAWQEGDRAESIEAYSQMVARRVMYWTVLYPAVKEFRKPEYWGGMLESASSHDSGVWPIEVYLKPLPEGFWKSGEE